jgi:23S rRNA (cytosine1962-C5)-methyltransferase
MPIFAITFVMLKISDKPAPRIPTVKVSARGAARLQARHPWVYRSDIVDATNVPPASLVRVTEDRRTSVRKNDAQIQPRKIDSKKTDSKKVADHNDRGKFLGFALYSSASQIALRFLSHHPVTDLPSLISERVRAAIAYRQKLDILSTTDACRLVFSEADFLPGLIVDRYNDILSLQILTQAMDTDPVRAAITETLENELHPASIIERVDPRIRELEQLPPRDSGLLRGTKSSTIITMNSNAAVASETQDPDSQVPKPSAQNLYAGIRLHYSALEGQKTGAFLDQRENYAAAARYAHGNALDVFCYHGGFSLHLALSQKCSAVTGVDSSRPALEMAEKNAALNHVLVNGKELEWIEANAFDLLRDYSAGTKEDRSIARYDTIVLDPPAFAKSRRDLEKALRGYKELNLRALKLLRPGGILVTCSCSFHVSAPDFLAVVAAAARDAHKDVRIIEFRAAARDHPMLLNVPETGYLKCLILSINN